MKRSIHRFPCAALALIALFFTSAVTQCPIRGLAVEVPDLEANQLQGLQLWRTDDETSQTYDENCRIVFGETTVLADGKEMMEYTLLSPEGELLARAARESSDELREVLAKLRRGEKLSTLVLYKVELLYQWKVGPSKLTGMRRNLVGPLCWSELFLK